MFNAPQVRKRRIKRIREILNYRNGDFYVGSLAIAECMRMLKLSFGRDKMSFDNASDVQVMHVWKYLEDHYGKHFDANPVRRCPCCGTMVPKSKLDAGVKR